MTDAADHSQGRQALPFLAPAVVALAAIGIVPLGYALYNSFTRFNLAKPNDPQLFIWFDNYWTLLNDSSFHEALLRTLLFLAMVLPIQLGLGLGIALMLHKPGLGLLRTLTRLSLVIPMATTYVVVGLMGRLMFNTEFGVVNDLLRALGLAPLEWLGDPVNAFIALGLMDVWQWTPFCALVLVAGFTMVPYEIEEAARLETRRWWRILAYVQLPYLLPGITALLILRTADILKMFDAIQTMTRGGPGTATELISVYIQRHGFKILDQGMASAQAVVLLILTIVLARMYIRFVYREVG